MECEDYILCTCVQSPRFQSPHLGLACNTESTRVSVLANVPGMLTGDAPGRSLPYSIPAPQKDPTKPWLTILR
ncbi:MAG: hypothetical protein JWP89_4947 [Schlesneria sp.]|nr:hypothetical protein [Schlesneria sp.]